MIANFYRPARPGRAPAILLLGGSEGGLGKAAAAQAAALAAHGYVVLQLSYFGSPGQPAALKSIPVETFTRALDWLKTQPGVAGNRIGIVGTSKGAEAALLVASRRSDLKIAVLGVPSSVVWPGIDRQGLVTESSWTEGGRPVPFTPMDGRGMARHPCPVCRRAGRSGQGRNGRHPGRAREGRHRDGLWRGGWAVAVLPDGAGGRSTVARRQLSTSRHGACLSRRGPCRFRPAPDPASQAASTAASLGGSIAGNRAARVDGWPKVLAALDAVLMPEAGR
ncbi:acyl-CoA thioester hydrolase/BAAT C-terminal domain-containing protein [Sphingomonas sp. I4]